MVKVGLEGGRLFDGVVIRVEEEYAVCLYRSNDPLL